MKRKGKRILAGIIFICAIQLIGCGNKEAVTDTQSTVANQENAASYANVEELFADSQMKAQIDAQYSEASNDQVQMSVTGSKNQLIVTAKCWEYIYSEEAKASFEETLDGVEEAMTAQAKQIAAMVQDADVSICVRYLDKNDKELASRVFYAQ